MKESIRVLILRLGLRFLLLCLALIGIKVQTNLSFGKGIKASNLIYSRSLHENINSRDSSPIQILYANQFVFQQTVPGNAGVGLSFSITVCANTGTTPDPTYTTPLDLLDNGSTATYTVLPANSITPTNGCVTFTLTPTSVGTLNLSFGNADFPNILTGPITVTNLVVPTVSYSVEIFDTDLLPTTQADTLNNGWEMDQGDSCRSIAGGIFETVYGDLNYDNVTYTGSITGLTQMKGGGIGQAYAGTVSFRLVNMDGPAKGTHFTNGNGTLNANPLTMQSNSPKPLAISGDLHYTEGTGNLSSRNALLFSFSTPVSNFGMWVGDIETNPFGTNASLVLFYEDAELARVPLLTSSTLAEQMDPITGCGSSPIYPGCGNHGTRWLSFADGPVTDLLLIVGDDELGGLGNTEHISFGGVSLGGSCIISILSQEFLRLRGEKNQEGISLTWQIPEGEIISYTVSRKNALGEFTKIAEQIKAGSWIDRKPIKGINTYRIESKDINGNQSFSAPLSITWEREEKIRIFPNPSKGKIFVSGGENPIQVEIYNEFGQLQRKATVFSDLGVIDISNLPQGMYISKLKSLGHHEVMRFLLNP